MEFFTHTSAVIVKENQLNIYVCVYIVWTLKSRNLIKNGERKKKKMVGLLLFIYLFVADGNKDEERKQSLWLDKR